MDHLQRLAPSGAVTRPFYLHADGTLSEAAPKTEPPSVFEYDPAHPVPSIGGQMNDSVGPAFPADGPRDQVCSAKTFGCDNDLPLAARHDVRVFQTPPLSTDVVIAGPVSVDLWISSSAPDTDFTAKLVDVAPPSKDYPFGFAMNIEDRIIRVRWSEGFDKPRPLNPGRFVESPWTLSRRGIVSQRAIAFAWISPAATFHTSMRIPIPANARAILLTPKKR